MEYLDASVIVALLTPEIHSDRAEAWLQRPHEEGMCVSPWVAAEVSSALSIKVRSGAISLERRAVVLARWHRMLRESLLTVAVTSEDFEAAARIADRHDLGIRAGDALHLAVAAASGHTLVTLDRTMAEAAPNVGVAVASI